VKQQGQETYTIARGDTLSGIADRFNVSVDSLRKQNNLSGSRILVGQKLIIPRS
jgi:N-acetylmuramoyl-L-alanine amidase